ncbi:hypothetical protein GCM10027273_24210 [Nocardioides pakistanensis]
MPVRDATEAGLLPELADHGVAGLLAGLDTAAGKHAVALAVLEAAQHEKAVAIEDNGDCTVRQVGHSHGL